MISDCGRTAQNITKAGVIPPLVNLLASANGEPAANAAGALASLAYDTVARIEIVRSGAIFGLPRLLSLSGTPGCLNAVFLMANLLRDVPLEDGSAELSAQHTCFQVARLWHSSHGIGGSPISTFEFASASCAVEFVGTLLLVPLRCWDGAGSHP